MMNDSPFDDFVKQQFSSYNPDVPEHILENILANRKTKPKGFWVNWLNKGTIWLASLLLITGISGYYFISQQTSKEKNNIKIPDQVTNVFPSSSKNKIKNSKENKDDILNRDEQIIKNKK